MTTIKATVTDGRLEVDVPPDWPDGTEVEIHPLEKAALDNDAMAPEEIAALLVAMDQIEPLDLTEPERAVWEAMSKDRKEWEKSHFIDHASKLHGMWE